MGDVPFRTEDSLDLHFGTSGGSMEISAVLGLHRRRSDTTAAAEPAGGFPADRFFVASTVTTARGFTGGCRGVFTLSLGGFARRNAVASARPSLPTAIKDSQ
jgi:hypothetical protein